MPKTVGTVKTRFVYNGWQRIADYDGTANTLQNRYVYGVKLDEPLIQVSSAGVLTYLHADRLGSIVATTSSAGAVTNTSKYSPYGENAPVGTTFGFTGQRFDSETGLYYYKRRYYSAVLGRFLQPDPIGYADNVNLYAYVKNDPLNKVDWLGLAPEIADKPPLQGHVGEDRQKPYDPGDYGTDPSTYKPNHNSTDSGSGKGGGDGNNNTSPDTGTGNSNNGMHFGPMQPGAGPGDTPPLNQGGNQGGSGAPPPDQGSQNAKLLNAYNL